MNPFQRIALFLTIIGTINMALIGFFQYDLIDLIFKSAISRTIYGIIGLAGLINLTLLFKPSDEPERESKEVKTT